MAAVVTPELHEGVAAPQSSSVNGTLRAPLPCFLPNPARVLVGACDEWLRHVEDQVTKSERVAAIQTLATAIQTSGAETRPRLESIPLMVRADQQIMPALRQLIERGPMCAEALLD